MFNREYHVRAVRREVRKALRFGAGLEFYRPAERPDPRPRSVASIDQPLGDVFPEAYADQSSIVTSPIPDPEPEPDEKSLPIGRKGRRTKSDAAQLVLFA